MKITELRSGSGDWVGIYKDGVLLFEGHDITLYTLFNYILTNIEYESIEDEEPYLDRFGGNCPGTLEEYYNELK
jgi:hypothetical protein